MRIAIVNDLALAREVLRRIVLSAPEHTIAWLAENGAEAVRRAAQDRPDIILMDLVMPVMDGVEATRQIMAATPCPILLVTSSVTGNLNQVYAAMGEGGLDAVNTPTFGPDGKVRDGEAILARIAKLARTQQFSTLRAEPSKLFSAHSATSENVPSQPRPSIVALGASTGGPEAVAQILSALPPDCPAAVLVVQHIAAEFAPGLASWLASRSRLPVRLARQRDEPTPGIVLLAGTDDNLVLQRDQRLSYTSEPANYPYRPSIDALFSSLARYWPGSGVAVLLTGMGSDGARGMQLLQQASWYTVAQDQATSVVYGMPKAAVDLKAVRQCLPLADIAAEITVQLARQQSARSRA
ncbi:MAG TPA: chemotaxis-specific protein-glutamate methyltransferase CheB [Pirellulales bacterium]|jgi:two-component system response regulator WspF